MEDIKKSFGWPDPVKTPVISSVPAPAQAAAPMTGKSPPPPADFTPQQMFADMRKLEADIRAAGNLLESMQQDFVGRFGAYEYPVEIDGKKKWARVFEAKGRYVYNVKYELGERLKAENPAPGAV